MLQRPGPAEVRRQGAGQPLREEAAQPFLHAGPGLLVPGPAQRRQRVRQGRQPVHGHRVPRRPETGHLQHGRAGEPPVGDQQGLREGAAAGFRAHLRADPAEFRQPRLVGGLQRERHQPGAGGQHLQAEPIRHPVGEGTGAQGGNGQAAGGDHQTLAAKLAARGAQAEAALVRVRLRRATGGALPHGPVIDVGHRGVQTHFGAGPLAFGEQHLKNRLAGGIAEQLARRLFHMADAVPFHHLHEMPGAVAVERRLAEVRVGGYEVVRGGVQVGEIAAPAAGHQDLLAGLIGVVQHQHRAAAVTGAGGAHQTRRAGADYHHIIVLHAVSFGVATLWERAMPAKGKRSLPAGYQRGCWCRR